MRVFVAGSSGFIGSNVSKRLETDGDEILYSAYKTSVQNADIKGDLSDPIALSKKIEGIDALCHFAADVAVKRYMENPFLFSKNVEITKNLLEFARLNDIPLVLFASSDRVYGSATGKVDEQTPANPNELYAASKLAGEALCSAYGKTYGIKFIILRIANVYGPGQKPELFIPSVIKQAITGDKITVGNTNAFRNFVYVKDVSSACSIMLKNKSACNNIFNIAESVVNMGDVLNNIIEIKKRVTGSSSTVNQDSSLSKPANIEMEKFTLVCKKACKFGWKPKYNIKKGLEETFLCEMKRGEKH